MIFDLIFLTLQIYIALSADTNLENVNIKKQCNSTFDPVAFEESSGKISNKLFIYLDSNRDNVLSESEWNRTAKLTRRFQYLKNTDVHIRFSEVDLDKNGTIEREEFTVYTTGRLASVNDQLSGIDDDALDYHKIKQDSRAVFYAAYQKICGQNLTDIEVKLIQYNNCIYSKDPKTCLQDLCVEDKKNECECSSEERSLKIRQARLYFNLALGFLFFDKMIKLSFFLSGIFLEEIWMLTFSVGVIFAILALIKISEAISTR